MVVKNPEFTHDGNLKDCRECPWDDTPTGRRGCQNHQCPTRDTYAASVIAAGQELGK